MDIGFIGLGQMGAPIAARLLSADAGYKLVVHDTRSEACERLESQGARVAASALEVAESAPLVFTCLPSEKVFRQVVLDRNGIRAGGAVRTLVDLSTVGVNTAVEVAGALQGTPITLLECPVSGGVRKAELGELTAMISGPKSAYDEIRNVLMRIAIPYFLGEKPGLAQTMKLINNLLSATALAVTAEAFVLGEKAGMDPKMMMAVLNAGTGRNSATETKFPDAVIPRTFRFGAATAVMVKDVSLYLEQADALGVPTPLAAKALEVWSMVEASLGPQADYTEIVRVLERQAGLDVS